MLPLPQSQVRSDQPTEYYQLSAFFDNIDEAGLYSYFTSAVPTPTLALPTEEQQAALDEHGPRFAGCEQEYRQAFVTRLADHASTQVERGKGSASEDFFAEAARGN